MDTVRLNKLKAACRNAVGKTGEDDQGDLFLPLWMHLADTAGIMRKLFEERISVHEKNMLVEVCGSESKALKLMELIGATHDVGKMTSIFQAKILSHLPDYQRFEIPLLNPSEYGEDAFSHHTYTGVVILLWLGYSLNFASLAGSHHGVLKANPLLAGTQKIKPGAFLYNHPRMFFGKAVLQNEWQSSWREISQSVLKMTGIESIDEIPLLDVHVLLYLAGLLVEADWISSNPDYFPLITMDNPQNADVYPGRIEEGWKKLDFSLSWKNRNSLNGPEQFKKLFGFEPNILQKNILSICSQIQKPGLMIIEAPMGMGKTEAAMAAADIYSQKADCGGVFFGLPTQATTNGLFPRFESWARKEAGSERLILKMMHGGAGFNKDYQKLPKGTASVGLSDKDGSVFLHDWMQGRKQGMLSDFVIGTVDQAFMSALKHRHLMLRHAGMAGKVVVIDEVHAYDAYMNVFFDRMLTWMGLYRSPVILLSATLPVKRRTQMVMAYLQGYTRDAEFGEESSAWMNSEAYPSILWTDGAEVHMEANMEIEQSVTVTMKKAEILEPDLEEESLKASLIQALSEGGCAGVIVNTVSRAQKIGHFLKDNLPKDYRIIVFHSRLTAADRRETENLVLKLVGKKSTAEQRNRVVIVGTQVIEQSLDIDFDILFTELAPMDLLLQRIGRLYRHQRQDRPASLKKPVCEVLIGKEGELDPAVRKIYDDFVQLRTEKYLPDSVVIPNDIPRLVNEVYRDFNPELDSAASKKLSDHRTTKESQSQDSAASRVLGTRMSKMERKQGLSGMMENADDINPEEYMVGSVRDIQPTVTCLLLKETENGDLVPAGRKGWDNSDGLWKIGFRPENISIDEIVSQKISLPPSLPFEKAESEILNKMTEQGLNSSLPKPLKHELVLLMNSSGETELSGFKLQYTPEFGLESFPLK